MSDHENGAAELGAVTILFFMSALLFGAARYITVNFTYFQRNSHEREEKMKADKLVESMVADMQGLKEYGYDEKNNALLYRLQEKYQDYGLVIGDVSSGYHLDFLSDADLMDEKLQQYLFLNGSSSDFIAWRSANGLSVDKLKWRPFIKEEAWLSCVSYGWINSSHIESFAYRVARASFERSNYEQLFPLVNDFPLININMAPPELLRPLITRASYKIENSEAKNEAIKNRLSQGPLLRSDISSILEIPYAHALFSYLGTKTAFWKINFSYRPEMFVEIIIAAIPDKDRGAQEIKEYMLVDRRFYYGP
jgi:hypothetical protein